jgi:hypothetical protein
MTKINLLYVSAPGCHPKGVWHRGAVLRESGAGMPKHIGDYLMFMDPCIIVQFLQNYSTKCKSLSKFIIPYLYKAQRVSSDTPPVIRSLKLH